MVFSFVHSQENEERKGWDKFRTQPPKDISGSLANKEFVEAASKVMKIIAYVICFIIVVTTAVISKGIGAAKRKTKRNETVM